MTEFSELKDTLYQDSEGRIELRIFNPNRQIFPEISDQQVIDDFCKKHRETDIYFGVATRDGKSHNGTRGGKANIVHIPAVWVDLDYKQTAKEKAALLLEDFPLKPSVVVSSGGGLHLYWILDKPAGPRDIEKVEEVNRRIAADISADKASTDAARVLRVPGTLNYKYDPPAPVRVEKIRDDRYTLGDFLKLLPTAGTPDFKSPSESGDGNRPGDIYNQTHATDDVLQILTRHGWTEHGSGPDRIYLTRPGKDPKDGSSATLFNTGAFYVFSNNAQPFEPQKTYSPFDVLTILEHGGNYTSAARCLAKTQDDVPPLPDPPVYLDEGPPPGPGPSSPAHIQNIEKPVFQFVHNAVVIEGLEPIQWRINDVLVENSFYYDFGDPGSFKSFVALDRLLCVAAGIDYHGHRVKQGTVFYIAGEGQQGLGRRLAAWHIAQKTRPEEIPFFMARTPAQLMDPDSTDAIRRAVDQLSKEYGPPAIVHLDTLARNFGDRDLIDEFIQHWRNLQGWTKGEIDARGISLLFSNDIQRKYYYRLGLDKIKVSRACKFRAFEPRAAG